MFPSSRQVLLGGLAGSGSGPDPQQMRMAGTLGLGAGDQEFPSNSLYRNLLPLAALAQKEDDHFPGIRVPVADCPHTFAIATATLHLESLQQPVCALWWRLAVSEVVGRCCHSRQHSRRMVHRLSKVGGYARIPAMPACLAGELLHQFRGSQSWPLGPHHAAWDDAALVLVIRSAGFRCPRGRRRLLRRCGR